MLLTGTKITCSDTGRVGALLSRTATGAYVCQDQQGRFIVTRRKTGKRGRRHREGQRVWLRIDEVDKPVLAVRIGATRFRCVEDAVWAGAIVDCSEAVVIGEAA